MSGENVLQFKADALLSDKFVEYSEKVTNLFAEKKRLIEKFKADIAAVDKDAEEAHAEFVQWQDAKRQQVAGGEKHPPVNGTKAVTPATIGATATTGKK